MQFIFAREYGTTKDHMTVKHGISRETVKTVFSRPMRDWQDGNHRVRICIAATGKKEMIRIAYDWLKLNEKVKIYSAYYWYP
jgi:hypothetical protein